MNPIMFSIFGVEFRWYSILILFSAIIGITMFIVEGKRFKFDKDFLFNLAFWVIIFGFIGARFYYCLFNFELYKDNLIDIIKIWEGGLAIHGGLIAGFITLIVQCKKHNIYPLRICDMVVVPVIFAQAIGRWGNFFNSEAYGSAVSYFTLKEWHIPNFIINGMYINGLYYHPTFFYESIWCVIGFIILLIIRRLKFIKKGMLTCIYVMWYSIGRFFIEALRTDSLMLGAFKQAQIISIVLFIVALCVFMVISRKGRYEDLYNEVDEAPISF